MVRGISRGISLHVQEFDHELRGVNAIGVRLAGLRATASRRRRVCPRACPSRASFRPQRGPRASGRRRLPGASGASRVWSPVRLAAEMPTGLPTSAFGLTFLDLGELLRLLRDLVLLLVERLDECPRVVLDVRQRAKPLLVAGLHLGRVRRRAASAWPRSRRPCRACSSPTGGAPRTASPTSRCQTVHRRR